jgi:hypothetical protein
MVRVSQQLKLAALQKRCEGVRLYQIAAAAGLHPTVASALLNDIRPVYEDDPRVIALGKAVGLSASECFARDSERR